MFVNALTAVSTRFMKILTPAVSGYLIDKHLVTEPGGFEIDVSKYTQLGMP